MADHRPSSTPCTLYDGYIRPDGYGECWIGGKRCRAHRAAWIRENGEIPLGMCVLHRCDNRKCINTNHLFLGTRRDNTNDMVSKGRQARGERSGVAKLTVRKVLTIRKMYKAGVRQREIGAEFGMSQSMVSIIVSRKGWAHV